MYRRMASNPSKNPDKAWILLLNKGEYAAFESIYRKYSGWVYNLPTLCCMIAAWRKM